MSKKQIGVFTSDLHLAPKAWLRHPGLEGDSYYSLKQIVDYCTNIGLRLFMAGDVIDKTRPDPKTVCVLNQQLHRMEYAKLAVYFTQGQHELDRNSPWLTSLSGWPIHIHKELYAIDGVNIYGIDWLPADMITQELNNIPAGTDILVAHQVWYDFMGERIGESECRLKDVANAKLVVTGDYHRQVDIIVDNFNNNPMRVLSPGSICMQSIDENPEKRFFVIFDDLSVQSITLKTRKCLRYKINNREELDLFLSANLAEAIQPQTGVPDNIAKNMVHIVYDDELPEAYARLTAAIGNKAHLFLAPTKKDVDIITIDTQRRRELATGGLEACLELITKKETTLYRDVMTLLKSNEPKDAIALLHQNFIERRTQNGCHVSATG